MNSSRAAAHDRDGLDRWRQTRASLPGQHAASARRAKAVLALTLAAMGGELLAGYLTGSLALQADGWHMGSHAAALGITTFAYSYATRHAASDRFAFGTGKVSALAGYSSAMLLSVVVFLVATEAVERLLSPKHVNFADALLVAVVGLVVNLVSAYLLSGGQLLHHHHHHHDHAGHAPHDHDAGRTSLAEHGHDHNLRAAYLHVLSDAFTSILAIGALLAGTLFGWARLDSVVAILAACVIAWWALGLLRASGRVLLDAEDYGHLRAEITRRIEADGDNRVADVRVWSLGGSARGAIVSVVTHRPRSANDYKALLEDLTDLHHVTVEVHVCDQAPCVLHGQVS
ncbi:MAG: CDF family Co(II)/Ni(II) efflux transporter DmeF [Betaproteobacteria bacterium]|nr:CDF family Co(II)/Ni(II) efflux transporter DmeF [Betaproteobacteria bacterium]